MTEHLALASALAAPAAFLALVVIVELNRAASALRQRVRIDRSGRDRRD